MLEHMQRGDMKQIFVWSFFAENAIINPLDKFFY
jgi:hypothetical protein